jgi:cell volume regulation protein A
MNFELFLIGASLLLVISILTSKISDRFGVPALLLFLILGMLAGSDGPGGVYFDDPALAQAIGVIALVAILFSGGLDTDWNSVRPVFKEGMLLSTVGVFITAIAVGLFSSWLLGFPVLEGLLLGAIVSSTDAAAVFSVLRSKGINLKGKLKPILELESGSNDPMAIFLTIGIISLIQNPDLGWIKLLEMFIFQLLVGSVIGLGMGRVMPVIINRLKLGNEGLYPVLTLALMFFTYGSADVLNGNGFLAVYLAGLSLGRCEFVHRRSLMRFHDGLAWLMQIAMFLTLGLLVFPTELPPVAGVGLLTALFLMLVGRPLSILIALAPSRLGWREKGLLSWVGLRGAVPIILATYPLLANLPQADLIFNLVFFVVLTSVLLQGASLTFVSRLLRVDAPAVPKRVYPIQYTRIGGFASELKELPVSTPGVPSLNMAGKAILELGLPDDFLVILIARQNNFLIPSGGTVLQPGDTLLVLSEQKWIDQMWGKYGIPPKGSEINGNR